MIDVELYQELICIDCKNNIVKEMNKLTRLQVLQAKFNPQRFAKKKANWVCADCRAKIEKHLLEKRRK